MNEKAIALQAWKTATKDERMTPLLKAIENAIRTSRRRSDTFRYAHELRAFARKIADCDHKSRGPSCLRYNKNWQGKWYVSNQDLEVFSRFEMWYDREAPENRGVETSGIRSALHVKRLQQAYDRYQKTGLRKEHCLLLAKMLWDVDTMRGDWISLHVEGKRPFGNSWIPGDIFEICGWKFKNVERITRAEEETAWNIFDELPFAAVDMAKWAASKIK